MRIKLGDKVIYRHECWLVLATVVGINPGRERLMLLMPAGDCEFVNFHDVEVLHEHQP